MIPIRPLLVLVLLLVSAVLAATSGVGAADATGSSESNSAESVDWRKLEKELKFASASKNPQMIGRVVAKLAALKNARACQLILKHVPFGIDRDLERKVGQHLVDMTDPESRSVIYEALRSSASHKTRIVLVAVAYHQVRRFNYEVAFEALIDGLGDKHATVVLAVVRWLGKLKDRAAVSALIKLLKREEKRPDGRLFQDVLRVLKGTTGEDLTAADDWKNYWDSRKDGVKKRNSRGRTTRVRSAPKFFKVKIDSDRVVFLVDVSDSMKTKDPPIEKEEKPKPKKTNKGTTGVRKKKEPEKKPEKKVDTSKLPIERQRLYRVKKELKVAIDHLPPSTKFTIVTFSHEIKFLNNSPTLVSAISSNKSKAQAWIDQMAYFGYTWTDTAFEEVFKKVKGFDTLILLSDGAPWRDNEEKIPEEDVLKHLREQNRFRKVRVHSIGFEQAGDNLKRFLRKIATQNDGTFTSLE